MLCGDWNIAHKEIDLKNWRGNRKNSGFLPEERAWLSQVFDELGWVDVYRRLHPDATGEAYTWWSNRGQAWAKNVGWRIDYQIATPGIAAKAKKAAIYKDAALQRSRAACASITTGSCSSGWIARAYAASPRPQRSRPGALSPVPAEFSLRWNKPCRPAV